MFHDRSTAGHQLAHELEKLLQDIPELSNPVVLALPRGGLPVGFEVARALRMPLDLLLVRKLGVPFQPELAAGAVVDGDHPELIINREVMAATGMREADLASLKTHALAEIERRRSLYLKGRRRLPVTDRTAIVVDDGIATGATVRAALKAVRRRKPRALILAVPVAPADTVDALSDEADHLVCLAKPEPFYAIGAHYADFTQAQDNEVVRILEEADRLIAADERADRP